MKRLQNRIVLVTGGNTGIGRGAALGFAAEGADVAIAFHGHEGEAVSAVREIEALGVRAHRVHVEVTDEASVEAMVASVLDRFGRIDVLVNNAGIQKPQPLAATTVADWDRMMAVHLRGAFLCCRAVARGMVERRSGRIIVVTSQLGYVGRGGYLAYSTAKGGLVTFVRALAQELAPHGVLVNAVAPGLTDTGFDPLPEETKRAYAARLPLGRLAVPEDLVGAFVLLASDEGRYFCGATLHLNGGELMA
ncbi:MAG: 3-oxoacyl-ACP reductase family protein [Thermodesulfobacteriota bacterium]